jgi:hypothetical protein
MAKKSDHGWLYAGLGVVAAAGVGYLVWRYVLDESTKESMKKSASNAVKRGRNMAEDAASTALDKGRDVAHSAMERSRDVAHTAMEKGRDVGRDVVARIRN